jgi:hypothetical protein
MMRSLFFTLSLCAACNSGASQGGPSPAGTTLPPPDDSGAGASADASAPLDSSPTDAARAGDGSAEAGSSRCADADVGIAVSGPFADDGGAGVTCAGTSCSPTESCCYSETADCWPNTADPSACYGLVECDGPEDCSDGGCAVTAAFGVYVAASCTADPCAPRACHSASDCASGEACCAPSTNAASGQSIGVCHAGPCG